MPYSPLYQSIHIVLFGAFGLTVLTTSTISAAALPESDAPATLPAASKSANNNLTADRSPHALSLKNTEPVSVTADNEVALSLASTSAAAFSAYETEDLVDPQTVPDTINTASDHSSKSAALPSEDPTKSEDSIERSLERLATFYKSKPKAAAEQGLTLEQFLDLNKSPQLTTKNAGLDSDFPADSDSPTWVTDVPEAADLDASDAIITPQAPSYDSRNDSQADDPSLAQGGPDDSARCEGRWVYPAAPNHTPNLSADTHITDDSDQPLYAQADYGYYDNADYAELSGDVVIDQGSQHIEAQKVVINLAENVAAAQGQVVFTDAATDPDLAVVSSSTRPTSQNQDFRSKTQAGGLIGVADSLAYNTQSGQSTAKDVAFASVPLQAHGYAKRLNRPTDNRYELDQVMFTTCPPNDRKWQIDAENIDLDTDSGRGVAYGSTFRIADVPVLYLPYFNFPIDDRRSSGFLLPHANISSESGLELDLPYYLNLAPNYDATINTHLYTNRNPMLSAEFRYLTDQFGSGQITGSYLPKDRKYNYNDRSSLFYHHDWSSTTIPRLAGDITYNYVSDADYLNDFDPLGKIDNTLNLPRRARLSYYNDMINGELKVETFQSLKAFNSTDTAIEDKDKPYSRLPQLSLNYRLPWLDQINISGVHDSAYFKKSIEDGSAAEKSGIRVYNKLSASYPIERAWGYALPKLSLQHLFASYDRDSLSDNQLSKEDGSQSVLVPQVSVDAGLHLYQAGSPFGWYDDSLGGYQLLSPRLKYTYAPYRNQSKLPNFNTTIASINYDQLYADSWFLGHDRLPDLNALTPGLNYRYIDAMGVTRFDGSIAEQFYFDDFDDGQVTLSESDRVFTDSSSGLVWEASAQPYHRFWVDISGALTNQYDLNYITTQLRYQPTADSLFNIGYIERQKDLNTNQLPLSAVTASTIFPLTKNWRVLAQGQYDLRRDTMLDSVVGIDYEDCCFGFALYGRRYYNDLNLSETPNQAIMAEIRLNGLSDDSSRLSRLLSDKVLGFDPVQVNWKQ